MAGATVIDQLIVKLGLDPKEFSKGQKRAAAEVVQLERSVKQSSSNMSKDVVAFTGKLLGIASAAAVVKAIGGGISDLSTTVRRLGIDSRNFGIAASELRNFQNIAEMEGGKAEDATRTIGNLTKAVYDLAFNGQISESLVMLGRLGVQFQDTAGNARNFKDIVVDTEKAIQQLMRNGTSRANANQMLLQAGFDPGLAQAILNGSVQEQLARQGSRRQVTGEVVDIATRWEKSAANRDQSIAAAGLRALPAQAEAGIAANEAIAQSADVAAGTQSLQGAADRVRETVPLYDKAIRGTADAMEWAAKLLDGKGAPASAYLFPSGRKHYENTIQEAARKHGVDPEVLAGLLNTESGFNPRAYNEGSGATGIAQLRPQYFPNAGKNPHEDIDTAAAELRRLTDLTAERQGLSGQALTESVLQQYNAGRSRVLGGKPLSQETLDYPGKVLGYAQGAVPTPGAVAGGSSSNTTINVGPVTLNTQATNADGIARDFAGATKRKLTAAQADRGMQ